MTKIRFGIIGGSGLYRMDGLQQVQEIHIETPFGAPSDAVAHVGFAQSVCAALSDLVARCRTRCCIVAVIGMTNMPEARLEPLLRTYLK